ncbi:hypothetical protein FACS1894123_09490 [Bacteroidia bacterium]|nr:hypothetical protein FACS1894123_09490 [Bacteroidia bacterium]
MKEMDRNKEIKRTLDSTNRTYSLNYTKETRVIRIQDSDSYRRITISREILKQTKSW